MDLNLKLNDTVLKSVTAHRHLGITLTNDLRWSTHVSNVVCAANKKLGLLKYHGSYLNYQQKSTFYLNFVRPVIEYGSLVYSNLTVKDILKLENVQRRAAIFCLSAHWRTPSSSLLTELGWDTLERRRQFSSYMYIFKIIRELLPTYILQIPILSRRISIYGTRSTDSSYVFEKPKCKTINYSKSFFPTAINGWSALPQDVKDCISFGELKSKLKHTLNLIPLILTPIII